MALPTNTEKQRLPAVLLLVSACVVIGLCVARVYPAFRRVRNLGKDILKAELQLEEQKILLPVYAKLVPLAAGQPAGEQLPSPRRLPHTEIPLLQTELRQLATAAGLRSLAIAPQADSLVSGSKRLEVEWRLTGPITSLRALLGSLATLDYIEHLGYVRVQQEGHDVQYHVGAWIALE